MRKFISLLVVMVLMSVAVAEFEKPKHDPCGKFTTDRILTHVLRHCEKAARDVNVPVSSQCCNDLTKVSISCYHAVFFSNAFRNVGVDPAVAITIPGRCHFRPPN